MPSQGTLIQKGKDFSFNEKPKQTKPHFSLSVSRALSLLQKGCYQPGPDSAALRERKKPNQTNKKSTLTQKSLLQPLHSRQSRARRAEERLGQCVEHAHTAQSPQLPAQAAPSLCPLPELLCGACAPRGPRQGRGTQGTKCMPCCGQALPGKR